MLYVARGMLNLESQTPTACAGIIAIIQGSFPFRVYINRTRCDGGELENPTSNPPSQEQFLRAITHNIMQYKQSFSAFLAVAIALTLPVAAAPAADVEVST